MPGSTRAKFLDRTVSLGIDEEPLRVPGEMGSLCGSSEAVAIEGDTKDLKLGVSSFKTFWSISEGS